MHFEKTLPEQEPTHRAIKSRKMKTPEDMYAFLLQCWDINRLGIVPDTKLLLLDAAERVIGIEPVLSDAFACFDLDPQQAVLRAIKANAHSFALAQSNPFGMVTPSVHDRRMAQRLTELSAENDLLFLDYLLMSANGYYSCTLDEYRLRNH